MYGLLGTDYEDPRTQGLLGLAMALLAGSGPSRTKQTFGSILGQAGMEGMQQYRVAKELKGRDEDRAQLKMLNDAKIQELLAAAELRKAKMAQGVDVTAPSSIREWQEFNQLSPEDQKRYLEMKRQMWQVSDIGGVPSLVGRSPGMATQPLSTLQAEAGAQELIAGAKERGTQAMRSQFTLDDVYNPATQRMEKRPRSMLLPPVQSAGDRARLQQDVLRQEGAQDSPYAKGPSGQPLPLSWGGVPAGPSAVEEAQSKATAKRMTEAPQKIKAMESAIDRSGLVLKKIDDAINNTTMLTAGPGSVLDFMPGAPARNYKGTIDTIIANIGFKELQNMRFESPTGGALGQVAVQELAMLQSVLSSLDRGQGTDQLKKNLAEIKRQYQGAMEKMRRAIAAEKHFLETGQDIGQSDPLGLR